MLLEMVFFVLVIGSLCGFVCVNGLVYISMGICMFAVIFAQYFLCAIFFSYEFKLFLYHWIRVFIFIGCSFMLDIIGVLILLLIVSVCLMINLYAFLYILEDWRSLEFVMLIFLFILSMCHLVVSGALLQLFIWWESIGLVSFLLISFWNNRINSVRSGVQAIGFGKVGDLVLCIGLVFFVFSGITVFSDVYCINLVTDRISVMFCLVLGGCFKTVHIIFHVWLPQAMEGPTAVSALLHSATLVTIGIILWSMFFYSIHWVIQIIFIVIAMISLIFFGIVIASIMDVKKVVAFSTASQMCYLSVCFFADAGIISLCHLVGHALFKALCFLVVGILLHAINNIQDCRFYFAFYKRHVGSFIFCWIAICALIGVFVLFGFWTKDLLITSIVGIFVCSIESLVIIFFFVCILSDCYVFFLVYCFSCSATSVISNGNDDISFSAWILLFWLSCCVVFFGGSLISYVLLHGFLDSIYFATSLIFIDSLLWQSRFVMLCVMYWLVLGLWLVNYLSVHSSSVIMFPVMSCVAFKLFIELCIELLCVIGSSFVTRMVCIEFFLFSMVQYNTFLLITLDKLSYGLSYFSVLGFVLLFFIGIAVF